MFPCSSLLRSYPSAIQIVFHVQIQRVVGQGMSNCTSKPKFEEGRNHNRGEANIPFTFPVIRCTIFGTPESLAVEIPPSQKNNKKNKVGGGYYYWS